ncbi:MAG: bifunctional 4-hydroxy-2-oxoglutarate aldolase/2-dehydro-3-deoxy-phosphogluconate aldolase [Candidatus Omnitrophica bacterium]|jgi:2-dehydro-3-deoxyphosphogluconate aldolase/(4S)-4-hydroxy-2-oxoglutarate aldolase|nr:bifunctional 4-hydroxy-2-oxoglutarate aldolase/2-dehydro-3-deoxy-phosphogluconate aldolase [Candidatus Omnitrophota bacterium]
MDIAKFRKQPVLGILRGVEENVIEPLLDTIIVSGLGTIEITMNTKDAPALIRKCVKYSKSRLAIGAGTVLGIKSLEDALNAGATFIVMPVLIKDVMAYCVKNEIPVFPGAFSPSEIYECWQQGATMVKVFPAGFLGAKYFKEIKGPFRDIELLACGGVTAENMPEYFLAGASAIAFGASVFKKDWLKKKDFSSIEESIKKFLVK